MCAFEYERKNEFIKVFSKILKTIDKIYEKERESAQSKDYHKLEKINSKK